MNILCPYCGDWHPIGVNATVEGCDECTGVVRNPIDNTIIEMDFSNVFDDDDDALTDMEKA